MKQLTLKEAVVKYGTESHKKIYKKKYSLNQKQKIEIKKIMLCKFEYVEFTKNEVGQIVIEIDSPREVLFPRISKKDILGNNTIDDLNQLLLQYILEFLESNKLSEEGYYNLTFLESNFDILTNFTRQYVKYETGIAIVNKDYLYLNRQFKGLEINNKNRLLYKVMHEELNRIVNDFRERILNFISKKIKLYTVERVQGAVVKLEKTELNNSEDDIAFDLRGEYENLSAVMKIEHDTIIDNLNKTLEVGLDFTDIFNSEEKNFKNISFISGDEDKINIEIPISIFENINNKIKAKEKELNLIKKFHGKQKPNYLKTENFKLISEDGELLKGELAKEEIEKLKSIGQYIDEENEYDYMSYKYYIGNNGGNLSFQDRLKVLDKYKKKYYRLQNSNNRKFYEISYFPTYYKFSSSMIKYPGYSSYVYDNLQIHKNPKLNELKFHLRNLLKNRFIESVNKQINKQYFYLENDSLDRLLMKELVDSFSELITES